MSRLRRSAPRRFPHLWSTRCGNRDVTPKQRESRQRRRRRRWTGRKKRSGKQHARSASWTPGVRQASAATTRVPTKVPTTGAIPCGYAASSSMIATFLGTGPMKTVVVEQPLATRRLGSMEGSRAFCSLCRRTFRATHIQYKRSTPPMTLTVYRLFILGLSVCSKYFLDYMQSDDYPPGGLRRYEQRRSGSTVDLGYRI